MNHIRQIQPTNQTDTYRKNNITFASTWPTRGSVSGGTIISLKGTGFEDTSELSCQFGQNIIVSAVFVSSTEISCSTPPSSTVSSVSLAVTVNGVDYSMSGAMFDYHKDSTVESVHPWKGPSTGGTIVLVSGENFVESEDLRCRFGKEEVLGRWISSKAIECMSPMVSNDESLNASSSLSVTLNGADYVESHARFQYYTNAEVLSILPSRK